MSDEPTDAVMIDRLTAIMRYVASMTRDKWARDYLCVRLKDLGHDATLIVPVETRGEFTGQEGGR